MKLSYLISLLRTQIAKHLTLVFSANLFAAGLGFLSILIISRSLTVSDFGLFNIAISIMLIAPYLSGLGTDTGMMKFIPAYLSRNDTAKANQVLKLTLQIRLITGFILATLTFCTAEFISSSIFGYPELANLFKLTSFGVLSFSILNYLKSSFYAYKMFGKYATLQLLVDIAKLLSLLILILVLKLNILSAVAVFAFIPLSGMLFGFWQIRSKLLRNEKPPSGLFGQLLSYSKWAFVSNACSRLFPYVAIFMLTGMLSSKAAGVYALALNLTYIFPIIIATLKSVLLPEASGFKAITQFEKYLKGALKISLYLTIVALPFFFLSKKIIPLFFGPRYLDSISIFNWLLLSYIFRLISSPIRAALYSMNKHYIIAFVDISRVAIMALGCYFLIPSLAISAPAIVALIINLAALGFFILYIFRHIDQEKLTIQEEAVITPAWL